jgi:tellurite resistance protein TerC
VALALAFNALIWLQPGWLFGPAHLQAAITAGDLAAGATLGDLGTLRAEQFLAAYLIEKALAVDNIFTIAAIFGMLAVPAAYQHRVLFYGIVGALLMRGVFIFAGMALITQFTWVIGVMGAFLIITGIKIALPGQAMDPKTHWFMRWCRRVLPLTEGYRGDRFTVREGGRLLLTPLALALVFVEFTDLVFAVDSIPAVLAISNDLFIVYTSNVFAILGLRSLYFALAGMMDRFAYLGFALAAILVFVGAKMILHQFAIKVPIELSLGVIASLLVLGVGVSWMLPPRSKAGAS